MREKAAFIGFKLIQQIDDPRDGDVRFLPGDASKVSLLERRLTFEMIIEAIERNGIQMTYHTSSYPEQIVIVTEIDGYAHCEPCGNAWRIITAWPSRRHQKKRPL